MYKVGDKVILKTESHLREEFEKTGKSIYGYINIPNEETVTESMYPYLGTVVTIAGVYQFSSGVAKYKISEDRGNWSWTESMILKAYLPDYPRTPTEDEKIFGKNTWVYCKAHRKPHMTGWCTVPVSEKVGLGASNEKEAIRKCIDFDLKMQGDYYE